MNKPLIFDIKRYAINDGPGIRLVVFFKGCNLHCAWCHNPEGISSVSERMYAPARCLRCGTCVMACTSNALTMTPQRIVTDTGLCKLCGHCAEVCPTKAIEITGKSFTLPEIMAEIEKERIFFDQSGGGVTISGGEPLLYSRFLIHLLKECGHRGIHRAVDTAGLADKKQLQEVASHTDLFLYDLKMMDPEKHKKWTGVSNKKILDNLKTLASNRSEYIIRLPLIGGVNDDVENITETARFISSLAGNHKEVNLLPYHKIAQTKYGKLGRPDEFKLLEEPGHAAKMRAIAIFMEYGIKASIY